MSHSDSTKSALSADTIKGMGYAEPRWINDQLGWCGLSPMLFTVGLVVDIGPTRYSHRFCYPDYSSAAKALREWDGHADPPGPWVKEKPAGRTNPLAGYWGHEL